MFAGFDEATRAMVRPAAAFQPDPANHEFYTRLRPIHAALASALADTNRQLHGLTG